ncbi:Zinc finger, RING/FYVE/PHD-type [Parasponia andersonii]|uniref:Zinc finger, RING/FYVE/PHD-type n=1 Tax=Parasponia andersonii TaxID=3476 RepID=A0A2P5AWK9_PARAD|nr:Zinc finger, RING/FYVE/PHD-type [Parasponia andersonii]
MAEEIVICHPFHPHHYLISQRHYDDKYDHDDTASRTKKYHTCSTCTRINFTFFYRCEQYPKCEFRICPACSAMEPNIEYPAHEHKLSFLEKIGDDDVECDASHGDYCKRGFHCDELDHTASSFIFRCVPCDFNIIHLLCGPLPYTILYEYHMHPLTLTRLVVEDDSGEYYCDICEGKRDERICVYYCETCKYMAHVHCLIDQITRVLKDDVEGGDLILSSSTRRENYTGKGQAVVKMEIKMKTLKDIVESLMGEEKERFEEHFDSHDGSNSSTIPGEYMFPSNADFERYVHSRFDKYINFRRLKLESSDLEVKVVKVKNYMVAWHLRNDVLNLLDKHGDQVIGDGLKLTLEMRSLAFNFLCQVIYDMGRTMTRDLTEDVLRDWYGYLKFVKRMGFRIKFVYEQLEKFKHDFFFLQLSRLKNDIPNKLFDKKSELQQQIVEIEAKLQKCKEL